MKVKDFKEMMDYLTRPEPPKPIMQAANAELKTFNRQPFYQEPKELVQDDKPAPQVDSIPLYQNVQPGVAIQETMPTYIPQETVPVMPSLPDLPNPQNKQIELATGGRVNLKDGTKEPPKIIPMDLESVAFRLFRDNLDNLTYNEKQIVYDYIEENRNKKADGGRIKLKKGSEEKYNPEIPSLGETDPIGILEQQLINEKDPIKVLALDYQLEKLKKESKVKEMEREEFKKSQKEKGIKYKEDFPSESAYFAETAKQLLTNPKYFLGKGAKGVVEGTEFLVGQPLQTLFSQEGKNFEFYQPVGGEKLGINKFIEENIPKGATTGTLVAGDVAEIAGSVADPFLAYGLGKAAIKGAKPKPPAAAADETIDPTRRDILKTGAVMAGGAALYPTAKKIGMLEEISKTKIAPIAKVTSKIENAPEWFENFLNVVVTPKNIVSKEKTKKVYTYKDPKTNKTVEAIDKGDSIDFSFETDSGMPANITYIKPKQIVDPKTGEVKNVPGEYIESELVYRGDGDIYTKDWEDEIVSGKEDIIKIASVKPTKVNEIE